MKLESARCLKQSLIAEFSPRGPVGAHRAYVREKGRDVTTRRVMAAAARGSLGLGVSGRKGNYRVAVRVYKESAEVARILGHIWHRCCGEVDERIVGRVFTQARWHRKRNRPLRIGGSVGRTDENAAGTLGAFAALRTRPQNDLVLSNNHVLAQENAGLRGDRIVQAGRLDGGRASRDVVAGLLKFKRLKRRHNLVDAAVAQLEGDVEYYYNWLEGLGPIRGLRTDPLDEGDLVYKVGRTTGLTKGRISAFEVDSVVVGGYNQGDLEFDDQIEIEPVGSKPFSLAGDSGSLIVDRGRRALGLLFAGNDVDVTYANTISNVLDALKIDLVY